MKKTIQMDQFFEQYDLLIQEKGQLLFEYHLYLILESHIKYENYDIALAMSSSRADPVLGHCPGWGYLNI